jgi:hypothetical protein
MGADGRCEIAAGLRLGGIEDPANRLPRILYGRSREDAPVRVAELRPRNSFA